MVEESELEKTESGGYKIQLKILNSLGSIINLTKRDPPTEAELITARQILSIDRNFID